MPPEIRCARSGEDRDRVYRFRYDIYVEEMNRYRSVADHRSRHLKEDVDDQSRLYLATEADRVVGAMRFTWGADAPLTPRHVQQYDLGPWLERVPPESIIVGERFMVLPEYRGTNLLFKMFQTYLKFVNAHRIQLIFGDCEPHLLNLYQGLGFRTYTRHNVSSAEAGYLIPLVMVPEDLEYMRAVDSPLLKVLEDFGEDARVPPAALELLRKDTAVFSRSFADPDEYWSRIHDALSNVGHRRISPFDGMTDEQADACLGKSSTIECAAGDRVLKKGNVARNMFIVLAGTLEVRDGERGLGTLTVGDVFGEMAFLLGTPRAADVYAVSDDVRILSLSESEIRGIIDTEPEIAAKLMLNVSKLLCQRILNRFQS